MARNPIVLIHGYSDDGAAFRAWERILEERGYDVAMIHACSYRSLTNEVTIKDIAEGFDRARATKKTQRARAAMDEWQRSSSGSQLIGYLGFGSEKSTDAPALAREAKWDGTLDISSLPADTGIKFFYPFTTTLIELRLNREPLPLTGKNEVAWF